MEKRIKLRSTSQTILGNGEKRESRKDLWSSKVQSLQGKTLKTTNKKDEKLNVKRRLSALKLKEEVKQKDQKKESNAQLKKTVGKKNNPLNNDDGKNDASLFAIKKKKRIESKFNERTSKFQSQIYEMEVHSEVTDEETQTSKADENNNKFTENGNTKEKSSRSIMDQSVIGDKSPENSQFFQEKTLSQMLDKNYISKEKLNDESILKKSTTEGRSGHYRFGDKPLQIIRSEYNENINDVIFTMNWKKNTEKDPPATSEISRQDLLKYDPLLLVYYYEKHIEFTQDPGYKAELELDRIPH